MSIHSCGLGDDELRLVVSPKTACQMLDVGVTQLYELLKAGELESYKDGKSRKILVSSIKARVRRLIEQSQVAVAIADDALRRKPAKSAPAPE